MNSSKNKSYKKLLITGASSPAGVAIMNYIFEKYKNIEIYTASRTKIEKNYINKNFIIDLKNKSTFNFGNVSFDFVINIASAVPSKYNDREEIFSINVDGLIEMFRKLNLSPSAKIINFSTQSVYNCPTDDVIYENSEKETLKSYGLSKFKFEMNLIDLYKDSDVSIANLRIPVLLCPNIKNNFISKWMNNIIKEEPVNISNLNSNFNAVVNIESLVDFLFKMKIGVKKSINVASSEPITMHEMCSYIHKKLNKVTKFQEITSSTKCQLIDTKLSEELGFIPPTTITIIDNYLRQGHFYE